MKGLINKCLQEFSVATLGDEAWEKIKDSAGCTEPFFNNNRDYPDEMTAALFQGASDVAGLPVETVLEECGKFAIPNTIAAAYSIHYGLGGESPRIFLMNIQRVLRTARRGFRDPTLPEFDCEGLPDGGLRITYSSFRGACPLLRGLIRGVGLHFRQELSLRRTMCQNDGADRCEFEVNTP